MTYSVSLRSCLDAKTTYLVYLLFTQELFVGLEKMSENELEEQGLLGPWKELNSYSYVIFTKSSTNASYPHAACSDIQTAACSDQKIN